jgi:hypothetical protein
MSASSRTSIARIPNDANNGDIHSEFGIILLGNTGVGKSLLSNILLGREVFKHQCSASSVTHVTKFETCSVGNLSYAVFDIPGLIEDNQAAIDRNKHEIYKAFEQRPNSVVAFVFTGGSGGRLKDEDLVAFRALHKSYDFKPESLVLIINDLLPDRDPDYAGTTIIRLEGLLNIPKLKVCFLDRINTKIPDEREKLCMQLVEFIVGQCKPTFHTKNIDIQLHVDEIKELKENSRRQREIFEQKIVDLQNEINVKNQEHAADNLRREQEYQAIKREMEEQRRMEEERQRKDAEEKGRLQQQIHVLENRPPQIVTEYIRKKKKHWWK